MHIGQKDSIIPDGKAIRADRLANKLSQEALALTSEKRFSVETLRRAERGTRISREKLGYIASALGVKIDSYILKKTVRPSPEYDCPQCSKGNLVLIGEITKASEGTFTRHFTTKQCTNCGEIISS